MKLLENEDKFMKIGEAGVYLYTLSLMISKPGVNIALGLMGIGLIGTLFKKKKFKLEKEEKLVLLFLVFMPLFSLFSPGGVKSFNVEISKIYRYLGIFFIPLFVNTRGIIKKMAGLLSVTLIVNFIKAMFIYKEIGWNMYFRYSSFGGNTLNEAHMLSMLSMLLFSLFVYSIKNSNIWIKIFNFLIFILSVAALVMSQGRGAWLAALGSFVTLLVLLLKDNKKLVIIVALIIAIFGGVSRTESFQNNQYIKRIKSIKDIDNDSPRIRLLMWEGATDMFKKHPVFGVGRDNSPEYYLDYFEKHDSYSLLSERYGLERIATAGNSHNMYFTTLAEAGLMILVFVGMLGYIFYNEIVIFIKSKDDKLIRYFVLGLAGMLVAFCIGGLTENSWQEIWKSNMVCWSIGVYLGIKKNIFRG